MEQVSRMTGSSEKICDEVRRWQGVVASPHRFGGTEFRVGKREIGHVHGDTLVDIPFPMQVRNELVASCRAVQHHVLPNSGWVSVYLKSEPDVDNAIALLKKSYDLAWEKVNNRKKQSGDDVHTSERQRA